MNVTQNVEQAAKIFPEKAAIIFEGRNISYGELNSQATRLASTMTKQGVGKGDRVALYLPNVPEFIICYIATLKIGAVAVSVNPMLKSGELKYILNDSGSILLCTVDELLPNVKKDDYPDLKHVLVCEGDAQGNPTISEWIQDGSESMASCDPDRDEIAVILYTSGTTGFPKGAMLTHGNVVSNSFSAAHHAGFTADDRMALFLPIFHVFGQNFIMNGTFNTCSTLVLFRRFVPDAVLQSIAKNRVTMFFAVPTIFINLLNMDLSDYDISSIRYDFSAAATLPQEIFLRWKERFGRQIHEGYGLTESSPFACYNHNYHHKFGSIGTPVENVEIKIKDEFDDDVPPGQWGEICIKGPGVMKGYWNRPDESERTLRNGWLHSGDIGKKDEDGYVFIVDRVKDMINAAGFKIWPAEVEQYLYRHPAIKELAVYGIPHPEKGEAVCASIVLKDDKKATPEEIIAYCRENMAAYKVPSRVLIIDELPKSATGKILKRELRAESKPIA
ncbi:long-chain fatty acid--CoA ligase [Desulfosarcina ovata subsp. sediminis]|uniref:Long-chain fatty acid--CoA ligase n=1 Tax=Desulfosarcina ovata subsp. sediminis TaxID=885957 RepID=A0A5K8A0U8_9BACT|nr:long-chain fatty acid--CoA ligase [Desulfosarcina ovata]BBO86205.1 long-chain fatty acid--CoA ligase [Desulfosarcina ovata subsp. sediminis]